MMRLVRVISNLRSLELFRRKAEIFRSSKNKNRASAKPDVQRAAGGMQRER